MRRKSEDSQIDLALRAILSDPETTIRKAAQIYDVSHATLARGRVKGAQSRRYSIPIHHSLRATEEDLFSSISSSLKPKDSRATRVSTRYGRSTTPLTWHAARR